MPTDLKKILDLIKRTGDKYIVGEKGDNFVVMQLEQYIELLKHKESTDSGTWGEVENQPDLSEINQEIASWSLQGEDQTSDLEELFLEKLEQNANKAENDQSEEPYYLEPID
ncbi:hypothetical protein A2223_02695 [Candidatus Falkowbacteria bacterium RIFOXYA2_FULL_35_8]|uniref:Uncharacterized protein n=1 Tax=Candidatus Falkowbacteria bacterium RIFOXYC2_FULL_36_12 TaxID=1798002 RepID=A0A1F5SWZ9_9BACT|nr:MAG: hypothetical protein A2300_04715 [Candidatus Falkowbacteria bacterium RIFOXYB2_FULL_35_7]OGF30983.1 MAG: hypothetical protein A2478_00895 [Candidatus Falkowbacteria bacterium RIFOXYC2_FULL_36_12]OGF34411.1 MAG: hypothetical protein A2223_02695 [Candidatus Falkowbacteria bacterium RIFOXYA2_FULL_35_8]